jgi:hypothetical protein
MIVIAMRTSSTRRDKEIFGGTANEAANMIKVVKEC